jgi:Ca2+-binding EF-hand superfamily protein
MVPRKILAAAGCALALVLSGGAGGGRAQAVDMALGALDPDHDGTLDLNEARNAATALFDRLDTDHDGTLDKKELKGRLGGSAFTASDPDRDGTISKDEYLALVEKRFKAADPDHDGTVSAAEAKTSAGQALLRLLK